MRLFVRPSQLCWPACTSNICQHPSAGTDQHGKPFHWSARRHRFKRHLKHHIQAQDSKVAQREFHWWKWLRFWQFCNDPDAALAYWSSWAFILGGIVFAISGLSGGIESVNCEGCLFVALGEVAECQGLVGCAVCMCNGNVRCKWEPSLACGFANTDLVGLT